MALQRCLWALRGRIRETANWRRLERFAIPGMAGFRIPALTGPDLRQLPAQGSTGSERPGILGGYGACGRGNPLLYSIFERFGIPGAPRASHALSN